jgi:uncharacterized protein YggE
VWALIAAVFIGGAFFVWGKTVETRDHSPTTISVSGEGRVFTAPDIAELSFGVQTGRKATAKEALAMLKDRMNAAFDAVKKTGVEEKDIQTESFWLNPVYDWTQNQGQVFRGFEASQSLRVKVRDLDKVSDVLEAATGAGANQAGGVNFTVDEPETKRAEAREKAIAQAKEKAQTMAASEVLRTALTDQARTRERRAAVYLNVRPRSRARSGRWLSEVGFLADLPFAYAVLDPANALPDDGNEGRSVDRILLVPYGLQRDLLRLEGASPADRAVRATREGTFALMRPVMTFTLGRCVESTR